MQVTITMTDGRTLEYEFEDSIVETQLVYNIEKGLIAACEKIEMPWITGYFDAAINAGHVTISDRYFDICLNRANVLALGDGGGPEPSQRTADSIDGYDSDDLGESPDY